MYVSKDTGEIVVDDGKRWATKKAVYDCSEKNRKDLNEKRPWQESLSGEILTDDYKPVCYRLTKYSTR